MLPYEKEADFLKKLFEQTDSIGSKLAIINKLSYEEKKHILEGILKTGDRTGIIIRAIALQLNKNDPLLDIKVCPKCGAMDSMHMFSEYRSRIDMNVRGYCCDKCKYESLEQDGLGGVEYAAVTLRKFIEVL